MRDVGEKFKTIEAKSLSLPYGSVNTVVYQEDSYAEYR